MDGLHIHLFFRRSSFAKKNEYTQKGTNFSFGCSLGDPNGAVPREGEGEGIPTPVRPCLGRDYREGYRYRRQFPVRWNSYVVLPHAVTCYAGRRIFGFGDRMLLGCFGDRMMLGFPIPQIFGFRTTNQQIRCCCRLIRFAMLCRNCT